MRSKPIRSWRAFAPIRVIRRCASDYFSLKTASRSFSTDSTLALGTLIADLKTLLVATAVSGGFGRALGSLGFLGSRGAEGGGSHKLMVPSEPLSPKISNVN